MKKKINFARIKLSNGVRLIMADLPSLSSVAVSVLVGAGSRFEKPASSGISHFLEHMVFKGTKNFPNQSLISETIEGVGGILNGYTSSQVTGFYAKVLPGFFNQAFSVISDLVLHPILREGEITAEKGVVLEEMKMKNDNPADEVLELSQESTWGDSPLGRSVLGSEKTIRGLGRSDLTEYHRSFYNAANIVVSIAGNFKKREVLSSVSEKFGLLRKTIPSSPQGCPETAGEILVRKKKISQAHLVLSFPTFAFGSPERYTLEMISSILGNGMSSRLFLNVRDKGLAYAVSSFSEFLVDTGAFFIYAGVDKERVPLSLETVLNEVGKLASEPIGDQELKKAREKIKGPFLFGLENSVRVSEYLGSQETVFGRIEDPDSYLKGLEEVTSADVLNLSRRIFRAENLSLAAVSPFGREQFEPPLRLYRESRR